MSRFHIAGDVKHPSNMNRKEKLKMIASLPGNEAVAWWLRNAAEISKKAAYEAIG